MSYLYYAMLCSAIAICCCYESLVIVKVKPLFNIYILKA